MRRRRPWRRWVGATVTFVRAALATIAPPGTVSAEVNERSVPTTRSPSKAAAVRLRSQSGRANSAQPSGRVVVEAAPHGVAPGLGSSSAVMVRTSIPMARR